MASVTRIRALSGSALLVALVLSGCGGGGGTHRKGERASKTAATGAALPPDEFPAAEPRRGDKRVIILRVGSVRITKAAYVHWDGVLTPKLATYEPKSRGDCGERARFEVKVSKQELHKLSPARIHALCVSQRQGEVKQSTLRKLISDHWVVGEAAELGVGVSEAEAQRRIAQDVGADFKSRAEFLSYIGASGRTPADTLLEIRAEIAAERLQEVIKHRVNAKLSGTTIARYYHAHKSSFEIPETRDVRVIRTQTRAAIAKAMAEVRGGRGIAAVAKRMSIDRPSNEHGGLIAGIAMGQEEPGLDRAIFAAKLRTLSGPLRVQGDYYSFEVVKIGVGHSKPLKEVASQAREMLSAELLRQEQADFVGVYRSKWLARTSCSPGYVISRCREYRGPDAMLSEQPYEFR